MRSDFSLNNSVPHTRLRFFLYRTFTVYTNMWTPSRKSGGIPCVRIRLSLSVEKARAHAGRVGRTRLTRSNSSQARTGTGGKKIQQFFHEMKCLKKNQNTPRPSEHPPVMGEKMSKRLGGIKDCCKYKTSSRHLNRFPDADNIGSTV